MHPQLKVCVLGGTGFVGSEIVSRLAAQGHWVRVPTRVFAHGNHLRVLPTVEVVVANVHEPRILDEIVGGMDAVINLVGILNEGGRDATFRVVHVDLVAKLIEAVRAARVRRLLHMSVLGADAQHAPSRYLRSRGEAETLLRDAAESVDWTILRPSVIFGPRDSLTRRFASLLRLAHGWLPLARPHARFAPIYVRDVAESFLRALHSQAACAQTYELCGPDVMTLSEVVRLTARAAGLPCHIVPLPDAVARLQGAVMGLLPGKPFSLDNFRTLTLDSLCHDDGCGRLDVRPQRMAAIVPDYLAPGGPPSRLNRHRGAAAV